MKKSNHILSLMQKDERAAFRALFEMYYDPLLLYCHRLLGDPAAAGDIVQECFISLWQGRRLEHFDGDLDGFIFRTVRNRALSYLRDKQRADSSRDAYAREHGEETADEARTERLEALYIAISRLPRRCREVFLMTCLDGKSYQEVAEELHVSVNTVKSQVKTALRHLRKRLDSSLFLTVLSFLSLPAPPAISRETSWKTRFNTYIRAH